MTTAKTMDKPRVGITVGDINGIGPEVIVKALADSRVASLITPVIYGSSKILSFYKKNLQAEDFNYTSSKGPGQYQTKMVNVVNCLDENLDVQPGTPTPQSGQAALTALRKALDDLRAGHLDALVTGPIDKANVHGPDFPYHGHTEFLTQTFQATESLMMLVSDHLRVGLVTEHVALKDVPRLVTKERLELKIRLMEFSLKKDFNIAKPRIAVLALNPHAGEQGLLGTEEDQVIRPVIADLKNKGKLIFGPFPSDGFFGAAQHLQYDGIVAMYHDQGLTPFKAMAFDSGVNFTAGLPIIRTSPDHGTAFNIAGTGKASEQSMREAIFLAASLVRSRLEAQGNQG